MASAGHPRRRAETGITHLELVVVVCIVGVLAAVAFERLLALRADAERAALEQVWGALRAGASLQMLALVVDGRDAELPELGRRNPVELLDEPPPNYVGALDDPDPGDVEPGRWYYDRGRGLLVYRVRYAEEFTSELAGPPRARFRVVFSYADRDRDGRFDPARDGIGGLRVVLAEPFHWRGRGFKSPPRRSEQSTRGDRA